MADGMNRTGKYRGVVAENEDPSKLGRIRVKVESVAGSNSLTWALPCFPVAGDGVAMVSIPPIGAQVLLEFLDGNIDLPVWVGGFWGDEDAVPERAASVSPDGTSMVFESAGVGIQISGGSGDSGVIRLYCGNGPSITLSADGIEIAAGNGTVTIDGTAVDLNNGALKVTQ